MKILVCVKWACDPVSLSKIKNLSELVNPGSSFRFQINRYDEYAVEEALRIKDCTASVQVDAITVGPKEATAALVRALGLGADHGIHILTHQEEAFEAFAVATRIADYARQREYDIIFTGVMSEDLMQGQVGPMVAALLSASCATAVIRQALASDGSRVRVERELEGGLSEAFELLLPAVLTIQSGINVPRYPKLSCMLRAKKYPFEQIDERATSAPVTRQEILRLYDPQRSRFGRMLNGSVEDKARELVKVLRKRAILP
jgi:electron transfer flavoprotein beta subunit